MQFYFWLHLQGIQRFQSTVAQIPLNQGAAVSPPKVSEGSFRLSLLGLCNPLVKKCYGCGQMLKISYLGKLMAPTAPHDLVIISATRRTFFQNGEKRTGKLSSVYFHCKTECIQRVQPAFLPFLVVVPGELRPRLLEVHKQFLLQELGIQWMSTRLFCRLLLIFLLGNTF